MLNGDFTAFASPACNAGRQVALTGGFANNQIDPSRLSSVALNFAKYLPTATAIRAGACSTASPTTTPSTRRIGKVDYTLSSRQSVLARYLYAVYENPATYDGQNVLTLSRTGQKNQAHSLVVGHNWLLSSSLINSVRVDLQQDDQRSPAAGVLHRHRPRQPHRQPARRLCGRST